MKIIKRTVIMALLLVCYWTSMGQFYDRTWLVGTYPMIRLRFDSSQVDTAFFWSGLPVNIAEGSASNVSDTLGNILFYYNGAQIANSLTHTMENGDTTTDSLFYNYFPNGFGEPHTNLILPASNNKFYVFYFSESDSLFSQNYQQPDRMYYAEVDMNSNGGMGKVLRKKQLVHSGIMGDCRLTACRHANGRDWWLVHQGFRNNQYFVYLVTSDSVYAPQIQQIGPAFYDDNNAAQSAFSPDGSKYVTVSSISPLFLMDFDRCTGIFSHPDSINIPIDSFRYNTLNYVTPYGGGSGCCFSSSGRFIYMANFFKIVQYDTWAANIANTATEIARWDSVGSVSSFWEFYDMFLLPNGKIIIADFNGGGNNYHLIDSPDLSGIRCHYNFNGIAVNTTSTTTLPNMINYRLGALRGSGCDTITGITDVMTSSKGLKIYPNPATEYLTVSLLSYHQNAKLYVYDAIGREVYRKENMYLDQEIDVRKFPSGVYSIQIISDDGDMSGRFVKE